jgi:hypothetical protein
VLSDGASSFEEVRGDSAIAADTSIPDVERAYRKAAIEGLRNDKTFWDGLRSQDGIKWGTVQRLLSEYAPEVVADQFKWARGVVKEALDSLLGPEDRGWMTERRDNKTWIKQTKSEPPATLPSQDPFDAVPPDYEEPPFDEEPPFEEEPPF